MARSRAGKCPGGSHDVKLAAAIASGDLRTKRLPSSLKRGQLVGQSLTQLFERTAFDLPHALLGNAEF